MDATSTTGLVHTITRGNMQLQGVTSHPMGLGIFPVLSRLVGLLAPVQTFPCFTILHITLRKRDYFQSACLSIRLTLNVLMEDLSEAFFFFVCTVSLDVRSSFREGGFTKTQYGLNSVVRNSNITYKPDLVILFEAILLTSNFNL